LITDRSDTLSLVLCFVSIHYTIAVFHYALTVVSFDEN
jgi:hypothetical protein